MFVSIDLKQSSYGQQKIKFYFLGGSLKLPFTGTKGPERSSLE
jgi:hypothetical protein